ncbi:MAG TPA: transcriptional regulator, partial [Vicinamibacteria bacterium]|nr:transcriptional regulator [Vicinamibacteria bacterium]
MTAEPLRACRLRFGVYELDPRGGELWREGLPVHIPPQPFKVLWLLASRAGDVVTREEIRQELWGNDTFVDFDGGLNFCINQIRKALRDNAESPRFIHTLPRRGYRFIASVERVPLPAAETPERPREAASEVADAADTKADTQQEGGDGTDEGAGPRPPRARASHLYEVVSEGEGEASRRWRPTGGPARVRLASSPIALEEPSAVDAEEPLPHGIAVEKRSEEPGAPPPPAVAPAPAVPTGAAPGPAVPPPAARRRLLAVTWPWIAVAMALSAAVIAVAVARHQSEPAYERVTFHRGTVATARFTPGGGVAYSAMWEGAGRQVFLTRPGEAQSRPIPVPDRTLVQSALASGELAVLLVRETGYVLALLPTGGGAPRELVADLSGA